jgi:hypothetical protein
VLCPPTHLPGFAESAVAKMFQSRGGATGYARYALAYPADPTIDFFYVYTPVFVKKKQKKPYMHHGKRTQQLLLAER